MKPQDYYTGPVEYMEPTYGAPYSIKDHCPNCGSTNLSGEELRGENGRSIRYTCNRCGKRFTLPMFRRTVRTNGDYAGRPAYKISGRHVMDEDRIIEREDIEDAMRNAAMEDDPNYHEVAGQFYGSYYYGESDDDFDGEWAGQLEGDLPWVEANNFVSRGYADSMRVGESYNMPDFDVKVTRVKNTKSRKQPGKKKSARKAPLFRKG